MKNLSLLFIAFLLLQFTSLAQDGWFEQTSGTTTNFSSVYFVNKDTGWVVGDTDSSHIFKTTDGGISWENKSITGGIAEGGFNSIHFINNEIGWVAGWEIGLGPGHPLLYKTTDGGNNWESSLNNFSFGGKLNSIIFIDEDKGWAVGERWYDIGVVINTTNGGIDWNMQLDSMDYVLNSVYFIDDNIGWAFGENGTILSTQDGGASWLPQISGTTVDLVDAIFIDNNNGWTVGIDVQVPPGQAIFGIYNTTNGGEQWNFQYGERGWQHSIYFTDENHGWSAGIPWILCTTNSGSEWYPQLVNNSEDLYSIYFTDNNHGWAVGESGTILATTNGGVSFVEEEEIDEIPTTYFLSNNFPNPFNPSTKIKYSVPQSSNVVIKVFDILGNEIETLVNEEKPIGTYEITWYAENLPSGIYFYRLQVGSFVETKKMVLMK